MPRGRTGLWHSALPAVFESALCLLTVSPSFFICIPDRIKAVVATGFASSKENYFPFTYGRNF